MKKLRRLQFRLALLLAGAFGIGILGALTSRGEIFPLASWFLFSLVPQQVVSYDLQVRHFNGHDFDPPKPFADVAGLLLSRPSISAYQLVQRYGVACEKKDAPGAAEALRLLSAKFSNAPLKFDVVRVSYDPLARWRTGQLNVETIAQP